jgi:Enoyl-(Acyl carrier protein) reductase
MTARLKPGEGNSAYSDMSNNPLGRVGEMPKLANLAIYLLHPGSAYVNGQIIAIDGGDFQATGGNFSSMRSWSDQQWQSARVATREVNDNDRAEHSGEVNAR